MSMMDTMTTASPRVDVIFTEVITALTDIIERHRVSWEEFGAALEPFEGWTFRLSMQDIATAE